MTGYKELVGLGVFSVTDVENMTGNKKTAYSVLYRLMKKGFVKRIRSNMYTCVNMATGEVIASKYQIACACNETAYLSHHTAFEYHGIANQVYFDMYISSETRFSSFEFEGIGYKYVASKFSDGVICPRNTLGIRVTDLERTVVDGIKDFEKIGGIEELLHSLMLIDYLDDQKLLKYLDAYNIQALYQKAGYILEHFKDDMQLSGSFFNYCQSKIGKSTRYLMKEARETGCYNKKWRLIAPQELLDITEQGGGELV